MSVMLGISSGYGLDETLPVAWDASRYSALKQKCPFALAAPTVAPPAPQASFAANWYVSGIARMGSEDFVSIKARDLSTQFTLYGRDPDPTNRVSLVRIEWVEGIGKSFVFIQKGTETAKLEFNEQTVRGPAQGPSTTFAGGGKAPGALSTPMPAGGRVIPLGPVKPGGPQRYLKTVPPPSGIASPAPNSAAASARPPVPGSNNVPRGIPPGMRRPPVTQ